MSWLPSVLALDIPNMIFPPTSLNRFRFSDRLLRKIRRGADQLRCVNALDDAARTLRHRREALA